RVDRAPTAARRRGELRPRERRPHPPRRQAPPLARGQEAHRVHVRPARLSSGSDPWKADALPSPLSSPARLHPLGLAALLSEVRGPWGVAQSLGLVARRELEEARE